MSHLKLPHLHTFLTVARTGSVSRAAEALNLTQPAVTARIKSLEQELGTALFERASTGMHLTKRGDMMQHYAEQFLHLTDRVAEHIVEDSSVDRLVRLGISETIAQSWLPDFVRALHARYPSLKIEISVDISFNLREQLLNRQVDLAILLGPISDYTVDNVVLPDEPLAWYRSAHDLAEVDVDLGRMPIATYARNTRPYRELQTELNRRFGPDISLFPSSSLSSCFRLVEAGMAVGALPVSLGQPLVDDGKLRVFDPGWLPSPLRFSASYLSEPGKHFLEQAARLAHDIAVSNGVHEAVR